MLTNTGKTKAKDQVKGKRIKILEYEEFALNCQSFKYLEMICKANDKFRNKIMFPKTK